jgi:hypothetical protein
MEVHENEIGTEGFRADLIVEGKVIEELKSVETAGLPPSDGPEAWVSVEFRRGTGEGRHHSNHPWRALIPSLCLRASVRTKRDRTKGSSGAAKAVRVCLQVFSRPTDPERSPVGERRLLLAADKPG